MASNTHWTRSRSVAVEGEGLEELGHHKEGVAGPSAQTERNEDPTPSSSDDDEGENPRNDDEGENPRCDEEKALRRTLEALQKKRRMVAL